MCNNGVVEVRASQKEDDVNNNPICSHISLSVGEHLVYWTAKEDVLVFIYSMKHATRLALGGVKSPI